MVSMNLSLARLLILSLAMTSPSRAQTPKTAVLLTVSGVRPSEYWKKGDSIDIPGAGSWHVAFGKLTLSSTDSSAHKALLTSNGDVEFFELPAAVKATQAKKWPPDRADLPAAIQDLRNAGTLNPTLSVDSPPYPKTREIDYYLRVPDPGPPHSTAQLVIAVPGAEPETLPISLDVAESQPFWRDPVLTTLLSALTGAAIGLLSFHWQQRFTRKADALKRFEERKVEKSTELWDFFQSTYLPLVNDAQLTELERVINIRRSLLGGRLYPLLPLDVVTGLNRLCDAKSISTTRLADLNAILRGAFEEFMS
jgi:hypothetical protein